MPNDDLYGVRAAPKSRQISSAASLSFAANLESILAAPASSKLSSGRGRPSKSKDDIFKAHNKGSKKRAATDLEEEEKMKHHEGFDEAALHRSKRKMEEKARLYNAMKRGDYVSTSGDGRNDQGQGLVDFDRKMVESRQTGQADSSSDEDLEEGQEQVEYEDEFGRARTGTRAQAARVSRMLRAKAEYAAEPDRFSARPVIPDQLIYGDTIQAEAFNPDATTERAMEAIAMKRDRSLTPPEEVHYDASGEIRSRGVGFYAFSKDAALRKIELAALEKETKETARRKSEYAAAKAKKVRDLDERRKKIAKLRGEKKAEAFLDGLGDSLLEHADDQNPETKPVK